MLDVRYFPSGPFSCIYNNIIYIVWRKVRASFWKCNISLRLLQSSVAQDSARLFLLVNLRNLPRTCNEMAFTVFLQAISLIFCECWSKGYWNMGQSGLEMVAVVL